MADNEPEAEGARYIRAQGLADAAMGDFLLN